MSLPIEEGCHALIINAIACPRNNGKAVKVLWQLDPLDVCPGFLGRPREPIWEVRGINGPLDYKCSGEISQEETRPYKESCLLRLDGPASSLDLIVTEEIPA
jgi:hypothetical protein